MAQTDGVQQILSWYQSDCPGTKANLARLLNHGRLAGTGKLVIHAGDQGLESGPARSFAANPASYDPLYHYELALRSGCNAYAAPLGFLEAGADQFAGQIPTLLKLNHSDTLFKDEDPQPAVTGCVDDALRLGCSAIGYTIHPGSENRIDMYEELRELIEEAKDTGLAAVVWSSPRGSGISGKGETAIDVVAYAAQIACQLGAHIVIAEPPSPHLEQGSARKVYEAEKIPIATLAERVRHVVQAAFDGRRIVVFSGGSARGTEAVLDEVQEIHAGGGFGSIVGRHAFQRSQTDAIDLFHKVQDVYAN